MVTRVFVQNRNLPSDLNAITGTDCEWYSSPAAVFISNWDTLTLLQQTTATTTCTTAGFVFDHDE